MRNSLLIIILTIFILYGCGRNFSEKGEDSQVVAKINNYELSVTDFKNEIDPTLANKYLSEDSKEAKRELLDDVITKKILLQEAQRENFDKDKAFM